jgi:hydrogenase nickel incorporation protein HypB
MDQSLIHQEIADAEPQIANQNRQLLRDAQVFTINIIGAAGCGKTTLIGHTLARLVITKRIGIIACDPATHRDGDRLASIAEQAVQVDTGEGNLLKASHIQQALAHLDLTQLDLLLIENVSSFVGPAELDLGEHVKAAVFSVTAGDDKPDKYSDVVTRSNVVILNKIDLASLVPFNLTTFREEVRRLNLSSPLFEMSALDGEGLDPWLDWLKGQILKPAKSPQFSRLSA